MPDPVVSSRSWKNFVVQKTAGKARPPTLRELGIKWRGLSDEEKDQYNADVQVQPSAPPAEAPRIEPNDTPYELGDHLWPVAAGLIDDVVTGS